MKDLETFFAFNTKMHSTLSSLAYTNEYGAEEESVIKYAE